MMAKIVGEPDHDLPRLIYADWLEEQGDPRAEFIRVQCARSAATVGTSEREALLLRERELLAEYRTEWLGPLLNLTQENWSFHRGLLSRVECSPEQFIQGDWQQVLQERLPVLGCNKLVLRGELNGGPMSRLASSPALSWFPGLEWCSSRLEDGQLEILASSPFLSRLSSLTLDHLHCTNAGLKTLARSDELPRLSSLVLRNTGAPALFTTSGVLEFLQQRPGLESLELRSLPRFQLHRFLERGGPLLGQLRELRLGFECAEPFEILAACPHFRKLHTLWIFSFKQIVTDEALRRMLRNPGFEQLHDFRFYNQTDARGVSRGLLQEIRERFPQGYPQVATQPPATRN